MRYFKLIYDHVAHMSRAGYVQCMERGRKKQPANAAATRAEAGQDAPRTRAGRVRLRTLDDLDNRTAAARRARELVADLETDLGGGLTTGERELVKRAAMLGAIVEDQEVRWLQRQPADLALYGTLVDRQRRILETLALRRVARDVTPAAPAAIDVTAEAIRRLEAMP